MDVGCANSKAASHKLPVDPSGIDRPCRAHAVPSAGAILLCPPQVLVAASTAGLLLFIGDTFTLLCAIIAAGLPVLYP